VGEKDTKNEENPRKERKKERWVKNWKRVRMIP